MRERDMLDAVCQRLSEPSNIGAALRGARGIPDHKPWSEAYLAGRAVLPARVDSQAQYVVIVLHHESLSIFALVEDDANGEDELGSGSWEGA